MSSIYRQDFIVINKTCANKDIVPSIIVEGHRMIRFPFNEPVRCSHSEATQAKARYIHFEIHRADDYLNAHKSAGKLLILRTQGIGDILLLTPALRALGKRYKEIHVGVRKRGPRGNESDLSYVLQNNPDIAKVWAHEIDSTHDWLREGYIDIIDLNYWAESHAKDRAINHRTVVFANRLGVEVDDMEPYFALDSDVVKRAETILPKEAGKKYIGIQVVASHTYRDYPYLEPLTLKLADAGYKVVLLCHFQKIKNEQLVRHSNVIDLQGKCALPETCGVINRLDGMFAADSGLMHLGLAIGIPTVAMFGICSSRFRVPGYKTYCDVMERRDLSCINCGDWAMQHCRNPNDIDGECMRYKVEEVFDRITKLPVRTIPAKIVESRRRVDPAQPKAPAIVRPKGKLWMAMMFQDEGKEQMQRFADEVISHPSIEKVIAINGGSQNGALGVLKKIGKVDVHLLPYHREYWNMQAHQRNASFSFVPDGMHAFFMDPDEAFGGDMADWISEFPGMGVDFAHVARATWDKRDEAQTQDFRPPGTHDWPDYQPRFYRWRHSYKFHGAAHHTTLGVPSPRNIPVNVFILHYEEESGKRIDRENQWAAMMQEKVKVIG